jgi:uncharacterized protein (TIGR03067 family)
MSGPLVTSVVTSENETVITLTLQSHIEDCWDEPALPDAGVVADLEALQGAWYSVSGRREAELLVSGHHFAFRFADGDIYMGAFDLDPATAPKLMVMRIDEGPARHRGKTALCIYELDGPLLRWCATDPGRDERLQAFPAEDHAHYLCMVFQREGPVA